MKKGVMPRGLDTLGGGWRGRSCLQSPVTSWVDRNAMYSGQVR